MQRVPQHPLWRLCRYSGWLCRVLHIILGLSSKTNHCWSFLVRLPSHNIAMYYWNTSPRFSRNFPTIAQSWGGGSPATPLEPDPTAETSLRIFQYFIQFARQHIREFDPIIAFDQRTRSTGNVISYITTTLKLEIVRVHAKGLSRVIDEQPIFIYHSEPINIPDTPSWFVSP